MDTKKSTARAAKDVRTSTTRSTERSQILSKRPSAPTAETTTSKKRERTSLPPAVPENDNASASPSPTPSTKPPSKAPVPIGRGRLPTGSLHTEARVPAEAETIKQRLTALVNTQQKLSDLRRASQKHFYEIGELLHRIRDQRLYEVKGYGSFEAFLEREVNLGQQFCLQVVRIYETFLPAAITTYGFHRLVAAVEALDRSATASSVSEVSRMTRSQIPPHKL